MDTTERILQTYIDGDSITRQNMWYRFNGLRGAFDDIEKAGGALDRGSFRPPAFSQKGLGRRGIMDFDRLPADRLKTMETSVIREILKVVSRPGMISLAGGMPAPESFPMDIMETLISRVLAKYNARAFQYDLTEGFVPLREALADYLQKKGVPTCVEDLLIATGSQGVLDAVGKVFVSKGDRIAVEAPTYLGVIQALTPYEPRFVPVETDGDGLIPGSLEKTLRENSIKFIYLVPTFQNPTGRTIPYERRQEIADIIQKYDTLLIEDDPYSALRYRGQALPPIKSLAPDHTVYVGSLSKVFAPGLRIGYAVAPAPIRNWLVMAKQGTDLHTSTFSQALGAEYISGGDMERHLPIIIDLYRSKQRAMLEALEKYFPQDFTWSHPQGGMFLWAEGPRGLDTEQLLEKAARENVAFVPGKFFYMTQGQGRESMRLNYTMADERSIHKGIKTLSRVIKESDF